MHNEVYDMCDVSLNAFVSQQWSFYFNIHNYDIIIRVSNVKVVTHNLTFSQFLIYF